MMILENQNPMIIIPTEPNELAELLDICSRDSFEVLFFLEKVAEKQGTPLDATLVSQILLDMWSSEETDNAE